MPQVIALAQWSRVCLIFTYSPMASVYILCPSLYWLEKAYCRRSSTSASPLPTWKGDDGPDSFDNSFLQSKMSRSQAGCLPGRCRIDKSSDSSGTPRSSSSSNSTAGPSSSASPFWPWQARMLHFLHSRQRPHLLTFSYLSFPLSSCFWPSAVVALGTRHPFV